MLTENDLVYYERRSEEERRRSSSASSDTIRRIHLDLASLYKKKVEQIRIDDAARAATSARP